MANLVALVGALLAIVGAIFGTLLLVIPEFVEVFVPLPDDSLSCAIGNLGVYQAAFDSSCMDPVDEAAARLDSLGAFESPTTEFKLLFPTQTNFITDVNPLYAASIENGVPAEALAPFFPAFEGDCEAHYTTLQAQQQTFWQFSKAGNGDQSIDNLIFKNFVATPADAFTALFTLDPESFGSQLINGLISSVGLILGEAGATLNSTQLATVGNTGVSTAAAAAGGNVSTASTIAMGTAGQLLEDNANLCGDALSNTITSCLIRIVAATDATYANNFFITGLNTSTFKAGTGLFGNMCLIVGATSPCALLPETNSILGNGLAIAAELEAVATGESLQKATDLKNALGALLAIYGVEDTLAAVDAGVNGAEVRSEAIDIISEYDSLNFTSPYKTCILYSTLGLIPATDQSACTFAFFMTPPVPLDGTKAPAYNAAFAGTIAALGGNPLDPTEEQAAIATEALSSLETFSNLFLGCQGVTTALNVAAGLGQFAKPAACFVDYFPSFILDGTFSFGLDENQPVDGVYAQAVASCLDDEKDIAAIETAQIMGPIGVAVIGLAAIAGAVAGLQSNGAISLVAALLSVVGAVMILGALLVVYNAPIYASVGEDPVTYEPNYQSGISLTFGLLAIVMGIVSSVVFCVSTKCGGDDGEGQDLKTVSI